MTEVLYLATLALHAAFVAYVLAGSVYALVQAVRRADDPIAHAIRDRLPFMLGCGITAGVAPLLFLQLLYQRRFYTANLLLGPRWMAIVPALIAGFYALYLAKQSARFRIAAFAVGTACFAFVAWSWSELHELMSADAAWRDLYAAGTRTFASTTVAARFVLFAGAMATLFATIAAWSHPARRLAAIALAGRAVSIAGAAWLVAQGFPTDGAWPVILAGAIAVDVGGRGLVLRDPGGAGLTIATAGGTAAMVAALVVREAPRLAFVEPEHPLSGGSGGLVVFAIAAALGTAAIAWIVKTVRT